MENFAVTIQVTPRRVCDLLVSAFEGATTYWCHEVEYQGTFREKAGLWYDDPAILNSELKIKVKYDAPDGKEGEGKGRKTVTLADIRAGLQLMGTKDPLHLADIVAEKGDGNTADTFWQYVVLGDVVYG